MTQPTKWSMPLGSGADVQDLPDDDLRYASFSKIFPQITQVPLSAGGVAPRRIDFNSLFKLLADNIYYYQNGGVFEYSDTADYEKGALVRYNDKIYLCIQDNSALNTHNPEDMDYWLRVALNNEVADYLPLTGGNLTGNLNIASSDGESILKLDSEQGSIYLDASSNIRGLFIKNVDNSSKAIISIERNGAATFNGTAFNANTDRFGHILDGIADAGTDYIRYSNGLQLCWGKYYTNPNPLTVTLPKPFKDTNYSVTVSEIDAKSGMITHNVLNITTSSFNVLTSQATCTGNYIAIGLWK